MAADPSLRFISAAIRACHSTVSKKIFKGSSSLLRSHCMQYPDRMALNSSPRHTPCLTPASFGSSEGTSSEVFAHWKWSQSLIDGQCTEHRRCWKALNNGLPQACILPYVFKQRFREPRLQASQTSFYLHTGRSPHDTVFDGFKVYANSLCTGFLLR